MVEKENNSNISQNKKIKLIIILIILLILFLGFSISINSTPESREKKIISYLEKKYNSKFKIIELKSSGKNVIFDGINCDGTQIIPTITDENVHYYTYDILSLSDNETFEVEYLDKKLIDKIIETPTYSSIKYENNILPSVLADINKNIIKLIGNHNSIINSDSIEFKFDEKLDDICDDDYEKKIEKISNYIMLKHIFNKYLDIEVCFEYSNNVSINFSSYGIFIIQYSDEYFEGAYSVLGSDYKYTKSYNDLQEYLNREKKWKC